MGHEEEDSNSLAVGLKVMLVSGFFLFGMIMFLILVHFCVKYLLKRQQRRHLNDLLYQVRTPIAPIDIISLELPNSGLDPLIIASLPQLLYKQTEQFSQGEIIECSVCLATIMEDATIRVLPNCKHIFHVDCVDKWFGSNTTCPICRAAAEPRVQLGGHGNWASQVQPTGPPVEDGPQVSNELEMEKVGCSGLRIASFHRMVSSRERSLISTLGSDGSAIEDIVIERY